MRFVIQRVSEAAVTINATIHNFINHGLVVLIGIEETDTPEDVDWLCQKTINMRIFCDEQGLMNRSVIDNEGSILLISQFTLFASTKKGNRPSFIKAAKPEQAIPLYEYAIAQLNQLLNKPIATGIFGADMKVSLINDGPVTILIDSKNRE